MNEMMTAILDLLAGNELLLLFAIIGTGYLAGSIRVAGLSLGVAAVLFVSMAYGAWDARLHLPEHLYALGLVLFVYAIGLQAGPGFFASFKRRGLRVNALALIVLVVGAILAWASGRLLHLDAASVAGLYCGAFTNTPALAATIEAVRAMPGASSAAGDSAVVAFGLAYPFGVFGVIFWLTFQSRRWKIDYPKETRELRPRHILNRTLLVSNPAIHGTTVAALLALVDHPAFHLSRIRKGDVVSIVTPETRLDPGDEIIAVGDAAALEKARLVLGADAGRQMDILKSPDGFAYRRVFVSNPAVIGKMIGELDLEHAFGATITRLRRGDVELVPSPETVLERGDRARVVTARENIDRVSQHLGDSASAITETDFLSLSLGIVIGILVGMIPLPLPNGSSFKLGFAGGPLIVALLLGRMERLGPITWGLPFAANLVLRQLGMVFFLAGIGIKAGHGLLDTLHHTGWPIIAAGAFMTTFVTVVTLQLGHHWLRLPMSAITGMMSGIQTQPACLAYAQQLSGNDVPPVWYASVFPASMVAKIILAQVLVTAFTRPA